MPWNALGELTVMAAAAAAIAAAAATMGLKILAYQLATFPAATQPDGTHVKKLFCCFKSVSLHWVLLLGKMRFYTYRQNIVFLLRSSSTVSENYSSRLEPSRDRWW